MDILLYLLARLVIGILQALPVTWSVWIGRQLGGLVHLLDRRHQRVARKNLAASFPEWSADQVRKAASENFRRIGENFSGAIALSARDSDQLADYLTLEGLENLGAGPPGQLLPDGGVFAIGHFGNFELYARLTHFVPGIIGVTTYRGLRPESINRLMQHLRKKSGCLYFERRNQGDELKATLQKRRVFLGLLADQHAGNRGLPLKFFGRLCSTSAAPAVFALRYHRPLHPVICYRTGLARWRMEVGPEIATRSGGRNRSSAEIMQEVNDYFEMAVRRDPPNWFWVHNRWKPFDRAATLKTPTAQESVSSAIARGS